MLVLDTTLSRDFTAVNSVARIITLPHAVDFYLFSLLQNQVPARTTNKT